MTLFKKISMALCLLVLLFTQSGCALLQLPFQLVGTAVDLAGQALQVADGLPKPPPWMFF